MKKLMLVVLALVLFAGLSGCRTAERTEEKSTAARTEQAQEVGGRISAREAYELALPAAQEWAADAFLTRLTNFSGCEEDDGKADCWNLRFYSPEKEAELEVDISEGEIRNTREKSPYAEERVPDGWADSTAVMKNARAHFPEGEHENYWLGLNAEQWRLKIDCADGTVYWLDFDLDGEFKEMREGDD